MAAPVPADMDKLTKLPGVGRKTANVVLGHALGVPGLPVDRHVLRVANRIGIARGRRSGQGRGTAVQAAAEGDVDARIGRADSPRAAHLQAEAAVRPLLRCGTTATTSSMSSSSSGVDLQVRLRK